MAIATILDRVTDWARENICAKLSLKVPPDREIDPTDASWDYERMTPAAFTLYVPAKDKLPPQIQSPIPSLCVRFLEGEDNLATELGGSLGLEFCFSTWEPGVHGMDVVLPNRDDALSPKRWTGPEAEAFFRRTGDGWRDAWNFVDVALREVESVTNIAGYTLDRSKPVKFGPLSEQKAIPDYYPFWFAWISFSIKYPILRNLRDVENLL